MIEILGGLPDKVVGLSVKGKLAGADYDDVIVPVIEDRLGRHSKIGLMVHLGDGFSGLREVFARDHVHGVVAGHHLGAAPRDRFAQELLFSVALAA